MEKWDGAKDIKKSKNWKELLFALVVNEKIPVSYYYKNIGKKYQVLPEKKLYVLLNQINTNDIQGLPQKKDFFWKETVLILCFRGDLSYKVYESIMKNEEKIFLDGVVKDILNIETLKK